MVRTYFGMGLGTFLGWVVGLTLFMQYPISRGDETERSAMFLRLILMSIGATIGTIAGGVADIVATLRKEPPVAPTA